MSSDYRPRGGGGSGGSGGRRRRGGRGRGGHVRDHSHNESRPHSNGSYAAPKKKEGFISKLLGMFTGKSRKTEAARPAPRSDSYSRSENKERTPRAERTERPERPKREERAPRPEPTPQEITSPKLYVGNLSYEAAESDLFDLFSKVGAVKNVEIAMDRRTSRSKGFGFVEMEALDSAKNAAEKLNRTDFMGRQIVVSGAKVDKRPEPSAPREESHEESAPASQEPSTEPSAERSTPDSTI